MAETLVFLKGVIVLWSVIIIVNFFHALFRVYVSVAGKDEIDVTQAKRAKSLLLSGALSVWLATVLVFILERILLGQTTGYSSVFLYYLGILFLLTAIVSAAVSVIIALSKNKSNRSHVLVFRKFVEVCFFFSIIFWYSTWAILQI